MHAWLFEFKGLANPLAWGATLTDADRKFTRVEKRPALLRALGRKDPPDVVTVRGCTYRRGSILKHDSWAATAIYRNQAGEKIICKFNRTQPIFIIPMAWLGRVLAAREAGFLRRLADVDLVPNDLGAVIVEGRSLSTAIARAYVEGEPFRIKEQVNLQFFDELRGLLAAIHAHDTAYVDLHKRENIIIDRDGRPHLIDFQLSLGLLSSWPGNGPWASFFVAKLQEGDIYHFNKHFASCVPETLTPEQRRKFQEVPPFIRLHRKIAVPIRAIRRKLLVFLRVRDAGGRASSELEPEDAFRPVAKKGEPTDQ